MRTWLLLLGVLACAPEPKPADDASHAGPESDADTDADADTDTDTDADTDVDTAPACAATVVSLSPANGELDVAPDAPIVAMFSEPVTAVELAVDHDVRGVVTLGGDGTFATFVPDADLGYATTYTATATVCEHTLSAAFTTEGDALPFDLTDRAYDIELDDESDLTWVSPSFGAYLVDNLATTSILFMVEYADTAQIDVVGAAGYEPADIVKQYPCSYALDFAPVPFTEHPRFEIGPLDTEMQASDITFDLYELAVAARFEEDGSAATDLVLTGLLDTRPLSEGLGLELCDLAAGLGESCVACPDGAVGCLELEVRDERAPWREGLWIDAALDPEVATVCD